jgi:hypothetical protein
MKRTSVPLKSTEPDQPARVYLTVIARDPEGRALQGAPIPQVKNEIEPTVISKTDVCETQQSPKERTVMRRRGELARNGVA